MKNQPSTSTSSRSKQTSAWTFINSTARLQAQIEGERPPGAPPTADELTGRLKRWRYLRILFFFLGLLRRALWWYYVVPRLFGDMGRSIAQSGESERFRKWAGEFRDLAINMGGVMIKLGQFISSRVDILPPEITEELAGLQDQVPVVPFKIIADTLSEDIGPGWRHHFSWFSETPIAAASLGQVHRAQLTDGDRVVVKIQRPNINQIIFTDLSALDVVARIAQRFRFIRRRANLPLVMEEFARVLWQEADYIHEALNAVRFCEMYADDMGVYVPGVYERFTTRRVLVLEDVTTIKIDDYVGLENAGVDRREVAQRLLETYLRQVFIEHFFHADPHPGNLFVYPLPENQNGSSSKRQFYLIFVDFGMTGRLTPQIAEGLRETLIAIITRDVRRLVRSYRQLGILLPEANIRRVEEATEAVFDQFWGMDMSQLTDVEFDVMEDLAHKFSDLLYAMPFQVPQDFVYLGRTVGILSGMCTGLDPRFDPWKTMQPFTEQLLAEDTKKTEKTAPGWNQLINWNTMRALVTPQRLSEVVVEGGKYLTQVAALPVQTQELLTHLERGDLEMGVKITEAIDQRLGRLDRIGRQMVLAVLFGSLTFSGSILYVNAEQGLGSAAFIVAGLLLLLIITRRNR